MGICGRLLSLYRREEPPIDKRGKACLANGELYTIKYSPHLRVRDVCIEICKQWNIAPVALDFFTLMTMDCEHCLRPNRQIKQQCDKQNNHYLNPKRVLHEEEIASKVFFFRLAFKAVAGPDLKVVNAGAYEYFVMQCRWDYINGRINHLSRKDHLTLLVLESIIRAHEEGTSCKEILDNPKRFGLAHLFIDEEYSSREIKSHLRKQLSQFKTAQNNIDKAKNSFLYVLEGVTDFGVTKIVVKKFYYQSVEDEAFVPVEWEISISPNGLKKRRTYKDERDVDNDDATGNDRVDEMISDYKDIEYLEIKQSESDEIIHISRQKASLEVISVGKSMIKKESLITLIEGFYHLFVNQYKTLTKYEPGLELPMSSTAQNRKLHVHGPIERKKVEALLKAVKTENGDRSGVHMIRRSRKVFDSYILSLVHGSEIKHYEIVYADDKYGIKNGPTFDNMTQLLEFYKTEQIRFPTLLTKYCPIPKEGLCALYDDQVVVEAPCIPSTSRPANPEYLFEYIGNRQLEKLHHTFTCGDIGDRIFKAIWLKRDKDGFQEVFCRRLETSRAPDFREKVVKAGENMAKLVHRNLVQFHGVQFNDEQNSYLAFEWIPTGTLDEYLKKETEVTVETILRFAAQIAEACMYLHEKNFVYGWLAAHNVLIVNDEQAKLSDVSVPCLREEDMLCETVNINRSPWKARECFQGRRYSKESDVWAFGIVLWEMFMKTVPFQNMEDDTILQIFQQDRHLAYPRCCPEVVGKIMKSCWITEPTRRPTFAQIVVKLRQIMVKLTPQEKERKIPETVDEKFTIEPLNINKPSETTPDENLPRTSSCSSGNHDNSDGTLKDIGSNEGSYMTDDFELDFIPEKESPDMLWSPDEIEMKKYQGKYPRPTLTMKEPSEDATYDRITQNDSFMEASDRTHLLGSEDESFALEERHMNEVQTAVDDPMKHQEHISEDNPNSSENVPDTTEIQPEDSTEDDPTDDEEGEEKPLIRKTNPSPAQPDAIFASLENMDHMGFLASQLGSGGTFMGHCTCTVMDKSSATMDNGNTFDAESGISEQESTSVPETSEISRIFSGNFDPFAADSENRANVIFSTTNNSESSIGKSAAPDEEKYVSNTIFQSRNSEYNSGNLNPMIVKQTPNSPYIMAGTKPGTNPSSSNQRRSRNNGYIPTPSGVRTKPRDHTTTPTRADNSHTTQSPQASLSGVVEFSKLDPFAVGSLGTVSESGGSPSNEARLPSQQTTSVNRQPINNSTHCKISGKAGRDDTIQDGGMFSSFLERDPMSELSINDREQPSNVAASTSKNLTAQKQSISPSVGKKNTAYVSPYSSNSSYPREKGAFYPGIDRNSITSAVPKVQAINKHTDRSSYVSMQCNIGFQNLCPKSHDGLTSDLSFSERDPFSEAVGEESKIEEPNTGISRTSGQKPRVLGPSGFSPASVRPTSITNATFENLFSKSPEAKSMDFSTPGMAPTRFTSPGIKPPSFVPSSPLGIAQGTRVPTSSVNNPQPSLPIAFRQPSLAKPSLGDLALKLSESRQSTAKPSLPKHPNSEGLKPTSLSNAQQPTKSKNAASTSSKNSGYVAVSKSKSAKNIKTSKVRAIDEQNPTPVNRSSDFVSLSNQDIFSDILKTSPVVSETSNAQLNLPSSASMDPFATKPSNFSGVKLYTEAESDRDPYQKISTSNAPANIVEPKPNNMQGYGKVPTRAGSAMGNASSTEKRAKNEAMLSSYSNAKHSPTPKRQAKSNYQPTFDGDSTSVQPNVFHFASDTTSKNRKTLSEKPRAKTPEQEGGPKVNVLDTADISKFSQTSLDDLLSSMSSHDNGEVDGAKPSQQIELNERPNRDNSMDHNVTNPTSTTENIGDHEVHTVLEMDNTEPEPLAIGLTLDNMDPFAASSQPDINRKSPQDVMRNNPENERGELNQDCELVSELASSGNVSNQGSNLGNKAVVVSSYSNAATPERPEPHEASNPTQFSEPQSELQKISCESPPGGNARNPPLFGKKPNANRKVSDLGNDYAKVTIQHDVSTSYEEPVFGAVGRGEPGAELPEQDIQVETLTDSGDDDKTVVDPFNMLAAEESIQKLDPSWSRGKKVPESFEESMKSHQIPFEYLTFGRELGQGAFGVVRKAKLTRPGHGHKTRTPMDVAVKCCKDNASEIYKDSFKQEAINLMKLKNNFIVKFLGVSYNEENSLLLVTELVPQGSLDKYLKDAKNLKILGNEVLLQFAIQITAGMQYLESKKLVHRDLAARNILVATESHVKISDFGLSRIYDDEYYRSRRTNQRLPIRWLAPECLEQKKFTVYSDVWSLGVTLWEMFSYGKRPYDDWDFSYASELIQLLNSGKQLARPGACPDDIYAHIRECWHLKPLSRISFFFLKAMLEEILKDKYTKKPYFT